MADTGSCKPEAGVGRNPSAEPPMDTNEGKLVTKMESAKKVGFSLRELPVLILKPLFVTALGQRQSGYAQDGVGPFLRHIEEKATRRLDHGADIAGSAQLHAEHVLQFSRQIFGVATPAWHLHLPEC